MNSFDFSSFGTWLTGWFSSEWLLAILLTLFLLDAILMSKVLSHVAVFLTSAWLCLRFLTWGKWTVFWAVLIFLAVYLAYYVIFARIVGSLVAKALLRGSPEEKLQRIVGQTGHIRIVAGTAMFKWSGEFWPIQEEHPDFRDGEVVKCIDFSDGCAVVEKTMPE